MTSLPYLTGYPPHLLERVERLQRDGELAAFVRERYPDTHTVRSNKELNAYVQALKQKHLRTAPPLGHAVYDNSLNVVHNALGLNVTTTRVQGAKLRKRREIRVAGLFKDAAPEFLRMIVVHELAHVKHSEHDRDFYRLCTYMEPDYHQLEFDMRLYLTALEDS